MNMRVFNNGIKLAKAVAGQAAGKISIPQCGHAINRASLKILGDPGRPGNPIAAHIRNSIESGQLFEFASKLLELGERMYSTPALQGRDSDKQPITHKPVLKFKPGQDKDLDLTDIYMQSPDEKLHGWDPSSHTDTTSPSPTSAAPQGQPAPDKSHLPRRPPADANSLASRAHMLYQQYKSQKPQTQASPQPKPEPKPSANDTAPPLSENVQRDLRPDLGLPKEAAPEQPRLSTKPAKAEIRHALKVIREARQDRRARIQKRRERRLKRREIKDGIAMNGLSSTEQRRTELQKMLNELSKSRQESNENYLKTSSENSSKLNY